MKITTDFRCKITYLYLFSFSSIYLPITISIFYVSYVPKRYQIIAFLSKHASIYILWVCSPPYATPCWDNASPNPTPYWPHRGIWFFLQPSGASRPSHYPLSPIPSMHPLASTRYAVSSRALQVVSARTSYWRIPRPPTLIYTSFGGHAAALLSDLR